MWRVLLLACLIAASSLPARAQPTSCVDYTDSWTKQYTNDPINFITYFVDIKLLSVAYVSTIMHIANGVPLSVAQHFESLGTGASPVPYWNSIRGSYLELLQAQNHCPLLAQNGDYLLSAPSRQDIPNH